MILSPMHLENEMQYKIAIYSSFNKKKNFNKKKKTEICHVFVFL